MDCHATLAVHVDRAKTGNGSRSQLVEKALPHPFLTRPMASRGPVLLPSWVGTLAGEPSAHVFFSAHLDGGLAGRRPSFRPGSIGQVRPPRHSRSLGHRQEPPASRDLLGAQRFGKPPGPVRDPARRHHRPRVPACACPTSTGRTSPPTRRATSMLEISATTAACWRSGRFTGSTSPTPTKAVTNPLPDRRRHLLRACRDRTDLTPRGCYYDAASASAIVVSKRFDGREAELFAVPFSPPAPLLRPATPRRIGVLPRFVEPATGASLSVDGQSAGGLFGAVTRIYRRGRDRPWDLAAEVRHDGPAGRRDHLGWGRPDPGERGAGRRSGGRGGLETRRGGWPTGWFIP